MKAGRPALKSGRRYATSGLTEAQFEPGSRGRVLKNLLGIKRKREMDQVVPPRFSESVVAGRRRRSVVPETSRFFGTIIVTLSPSRSS